MNLFLFCPFLQQSGSFILCLYLVGFISSQHEPVEQVPAADWQGKCPQIIVARKFRELRNRALDSSKPVQTVIFVILNYFPG